MANVGAVCTTFKKELLLGAHQFGTVTLVSRTSLTTPNADVFKIALLTPAGSASKLTTLFSEVSANEVAAAGGYTAGGISLTWAAPAVDNTTTGVAFTTPTAPSPLQWTGVSFTTDCAFIYNFTQSGKAVAAYTFSSQTVAAGNFTLTMPSNTYLLGLLRIE